MAKGVVKFHVLEPFPFSDRKSLKESIRALMDEEGITFSSLDYIFCSDEYLLQINQTYLQHDELTDIITFNLSENKEEVIGEIYISVERIADNALLFSKTFENEFKRVVFHGALHLCGYNDKTAAEAGEMRSKEDYYLTKAG